MLYNDLRYPDKNGVPTKAAFVRKIKVADGKTIAKDGVLVQNLNDNYFQTLK